jgi:hypothetical protein
MLHERKAAGCERAHVCDDVDDAAAVGLHVLRVHFTRHWQTRASGAIARKTRSDNKLSRVGSSSCSLKNPPVRLVRTTASQPLELMRASGAGNWPPACSAARRAQ